MSQETGSKTLLARRRLVALVTPLWLAGTLFVAAYAIHGGMGSENAIRLPLESEMRPLLYLPEGWKFFTRDAREDRLFMFRKADDGSWVRADLGPNASRENWFGISRKGRVESIEIGLLSTSIPKSALSECNDIPEKCFSALPPTLRIPNTATTRRHCGVYGVAWIPPVPWAWSQFPARHVMPSHVIVVELQC